MRRVVTGIERIDMDNMITPELRLALSKEISIHQSKVQSLYQKLDRQFGLHGAELPITFGYDTDVLGKYVSRSDGREGFHFSLLFIGYGVAHPLSAEDRKDLFLHEYAHYMQYNMPIPKKYNFSPGIHGSAWKYCCSLVGAAPTPYYKAGESLMHHDYDKKLRNPMKDKSVPIRDHYQQTQKYRQTRDSQVKFAVNDTVEHPKFGRGIVEEVVPLAGSVRLHVRFGDDVKKIDQKWLLRSNMKSYNDRKIT